MHGGIGVCWAVSGRCDRSELLTLRFLHTDPSTLFFHTRYASWLPKSFVNSLGLLPVLST